MLAVGALLCVARSGECPPSPPAPVPSSDFDGSGRDEALGGGVRLIPAEMLATGGKCHGVTDPREPAGEGP
jgi:hypothetical protein